jgi:hypothetical protein
MPLCVRLPEPSLCDPAAADFDEGPGHWLLLLLSLLLLLQAAAQRGTGRADSTSLGGDLPACQRTPLRCAGQVVAFPSPSSALF